MNRTIDHLIRARQTSDGAGVRLRRSLGLGASARPDPFLMLDEFDSEHPDDYIGGFPSHPHRGFETVTVMLEGRMLHQDHLGNRGELRPGDVQWMTAGSGIIHSEMPQQEQGRMRGFQLWINLPAAEKMKPPSYRDIGAGDIPTVTAAEGVQVRVIAGMLELASGPVTGPVSGLTVDPRLLDADLEGGVSWSLPVSGTATVVVYVYEGRVSIESATVSAGHAAVLGQGDRVLLRAEEGSRLLVLAAEPIGEPVVQYGPFVMNTQNEIEQALMDYRNGVLAWRPDAGTTAPAR